jgi:diguanylate cyclase (GGDEF)-like protein
MPSDRAQTPPAPAGGLAPWRDRLTGLPNRFELGEQLAQCAREARSTVGFRFALLYLDVDRFQTINESLGPPTGDALLTEIATRLGAALRAEDGIAREHPNPAAHLGGDEFVILLRGIGGEADAQRVAERLRNELERPYQVRGYALSISFSIGIVLSGYGSDSPEEMLSDAGSAMGEAKLRGRRRSVFFDIGMRQRVRRRRALRNDLHVALEKAQMSLVYQPLMNLETGTIAGCEVLLRWNHPTLGGVSPAEFIPIAEDSGVILELGDWVLREAIREYGGWRKRLGALTPETLSVNLSRAQLILDDLAPKIEAMLLAAEVEPWRLHLEITETAVMRDLEQALRTLHALRAIGVKLDLDDFGTGYSSLANLHQLPLDVIKIDRSFVRRLEADRRSAALIEAVIRLARILDLKVVAEGIETPRELEQLQAIGCQLGQGYLFAQPLPADEFAGFLSAGDRLEVLALQSLATLAS